MIGWARRPRSIGRLCGRGEVPGTFEIATGDAEYSVMEGLVMKRIH